MVAAGPIRPWGGTLDYGICSIWIPQPQTLKPATWSSTGKF